MYLTPQEQQQINGLVAEVEAATGAQVLAAVIGKADAYPEIPWRAFAAGAAAAALAVALHGWLRPDWVAPHPALLHAVAILGAGAACGLLTVFVPAFARLFVDRLRADAEVRQHAQALFLEHELFRTPQRTGILLLISRFEREVVILADTAARSRLGETGLQAIISRMTPPLAAGRTAAALDAGLHALKARLLDSGLRANGGGTDDVAARLVEQKGA